MLVLQIENHQQQIKQILRKNSKSSHWWIDFLSIDLLTNHFSCACTNYMGTLIHNKTYLISSSYILDTTFLICEVTSDQSC